MTTDAPAGPCRFTAGTVLPLTGLTTAVLEVGLRPDVVIAAGLVGADGHFTLSQGRAPRPATDPT